MSLSFYFIFFTEVYALACLEDRSTAILSQEEGTPTTIVENDTFSMLSASQPTEEAVVDEGTLLFLRIYRLNFLDLSAIQLIPILL